MKTRITHIILTSASLFLAVFCYSQNPALKEIDSFIAIREINQSFGKLNTLDSASLKNSENAQYYLLLGKTFLLDNQHDKGFDYLMTARKKFKNLDSFAKVAEINLQIIQNLNSVEYDQLDLKPFMEEYLSYAEDLKDPALLATAYMQLGKTFINSEPDKTIIYFRKALRENQKTSDSLLTAKIHHNLGVLFAEHTTFKDSALYHYNLALAEYQVRNLTDFISYIYNNKARVYTLQENYELAIINYLKADSLNVKEYRKENKRLLYSNLSQVYEKKEDYNNALTYLKLQNTYRDSISQDVQNQGMLDIQTKYGVEKKEHENLKLKQNRTYLLVALALLILLLFIGYLSYKTLNSKKKLSEKENELQGQKLEKLLKDQELAGIDAMVAGQEKERQRIANDLHDNLGGILATLKLHFQNLKVKKNRLKEEEDRLLNQTDELIDEAYQEVRNMAHARNAGVPAQEGLIPAVKNFAAKVSTSNKLVIEVVDYGMEDKLENSLEITIFRIIQELVTNVIKHAQATEAFIHLTHHNANINVMIEDNGKGFDTSLLKPRDGMGIYSIQKRIEALEGTVNIESVPGNGTTVIIDIPIV